MPQISKAARAALVTWLGDATHGFNAAHAAIFASYGLTAAIAVNWTPGAANKQLYQSYHKPEDIMASGVAKFPLVCVYAEASANRDDEKFHTFAGVVQLCIDFHYSFKQENALAAADDTIDSIEDALITVINNRAWTAANTASLVYEGEISCQRFPLLEGASNWTQTLRTRLKFAVYA